MTASILDQLDRLADEHPDKLLYSFLDVNGDSSEKLYVLLCFFNARRPSPRTWAKMAASPPATASSSPTRRVWR